MNQRKSFYRKVTYGILIAVLLFPLSLLSSPSTSDSPGGKLAQLRTEYHLSQSDLGEIDPASEAMKLATFGMRGLAVNYLSGKADHFKKVEDWTSLDATLRQLARLQPNFITFWKYQSWNLSYNVSTEFDDYRDRYYWVRQGIQFLQQGVRYNRDNPDLLWELGWVNGQKIGRADEKKQYRRLYKADDEMHPKDRTPEQRDNWLVSKLHYLESIAAVDEKGKSLGRKSPSIYYSSAPKSQMNYAEAIGKEGRFDKSVAAWTKAAENWRDYGNILIEHSTGVYLRFNDLDDLAEQIKDKSAKMKDLLEDVEEKALAAAEASLTDEQREALALSKEDRTDKQQSLVYETNKILTITPQKLAEAVAKESPGKQREAALLAADLTNLQRTQRFTLSYRDTTNFDYWKLRCDFEQDPSTVKAHEAIFRAKQAFNNDADPIRSKELFEEAFGHWADVFEKFPKLSNVDDTTGDDVMEEILKYNRVLEQLDEEIPEDFPLWFILQDFDSDQIFSIQLSEHYQREKEAEASAESNDATVVPAEEETTSEDEEETSEEQADSETKELAEAETESDSTPTAESETESE